MKIVKRLLIFIMFVLLIITSLLSIYFLNHGGIELIKSAVSDLGFFKAILEFFKKLFTKA